MRIEEEGNRKPSLAGMPDGQTPDVTPDELHVEDEDLYGATEDPVWSLKESGSAG